MQRRYPLSHCWKLFGTDNKGLQRWLQRAAIEPKISAADHRTKYLTQEQLQQLATFLNRPLPDTSATEEPSSPGAYKLLLDQVEELDQAVEKAFGQTHEAIAAVRERAECEMQAVHTTLEERRQAWQQLANQHRQLQESLVTLAGHTEELRQALAQHQVAHTEYGQLQESEAQERARTLDHFQQHQQETLARLEELSTTQEEGYQAFATQIGDLRDQVQTQLTRVSQQIETLVEHLSLVVTTQQERQQQVDTLTMALATETEQRQRLAEQVMQLTEELHRIQHAESVAPQPAPRPTRRRKKTSGASATEGTEQQGGESSERAWFQP